MDADDAASPTSTTTTTTTTTITSPTRTAHDRPIRAPSGPRVRTKIRHQDMADTPTSPSSTFSRPVSPSADLAIDISLTYTPNTPRPPSPAHTDVAVQVPLPSTATTPSKSAATTLVVPPPLPPPPNITFDKTPIPWKGLPLEVAQWTFSSAELQEIVSKAIRLSSRESFVRLLSLQALEVDIVHESERLDSARAAAQAKWRFEVGRRTMLMQALNATVASSAPSGSENDGDNLVGSFISQLASSIASCDAVLSSILQYSDQQSQIALIQHQHWASALGIALRKLSKTYDRQGQELKRVQARVQTLEDELEEAWREAEKMAIEFDELEHEVTASDDEDVAHVPEEAPADPDIGVRVQDTPTYHSLQVKQDLDETGTLGDLTIHTDIAVVLGVTATAVASKATLLNSPGSPKPTNKDKSDTKSIRSIKSTRSRWSTRDGPSHLSRLSAARTRSRAASNASLRLPKTLRSTPSARTSIDAPPIPIIRPPNAAQDQSFLDMDTVLQEHVRNSLPPRHPEPNVALPLPPQSAGLPETRVPTIWLETDGGKSTRLNGLDRTHSLQIFSSLIGRTPKKTRRSNLVMSLTGSDRGSDSVTESPIEGGAAGSIGSAPILGSSKGMGLSTASNSPVSMTSGSPVSLPTHAHSSFHFRGPSLSSSNGSVGTVARGRGRMSIGAAIGRPGSAGARLTTTRDTRMPVATPRRSLVSRASSVILRRLSQATMGNGRLMGEGKKGPRLASPSGSRDALRLNGSAHALVEGWKEEGEGEEEGEVMVIGSPHAESFDDP